MSKFHYFAKGKFGIADLGAMAIIVYPDAWEHEEFLEFVEGVRGMMRSDIFSLLVWANGQALSAKERAVLSERLPAPKNAPPMRQALLTDSTLMRGVLTAVGWIVNKADYRMRAFSTSEARAAIEWLTATAQFSVEDALRALDTLRAALALEREKGKSA